MAKRIRKPKPAAAPEAIPASPQARAVGTPEGTPVRLADGNLWVLSLFAPNRTPQDVWDTLYDHNVLRSRYDAEDVLVAAYRLLRANYQLSPEEAFELFRGVDPRDLVPAVELALFGPKREHVTASLWEWSALVSNGIDPETVDPAKKPYLLRQLVARGDAMPEEKFISSQKAMSRRHALLNFGKDGR